MMNNLIHFTVVFIAVLISVTGGEEVYAQVGETVNLRATGINTQNDYVYWYFVSSGSLQIAWNNPYGGWKFIEDKHWKSRLTASEKSLTIKDFQEDFFGTFICEVKSNFKTVSKTEYKVLKFNVSMDPASPLLPGEDLSLACDLGIPPTQNKPQIHWLNPGKEKVKNNRASFKIRATTRDNGQWTCVVTNGKEYMASVSVTVLELSPVPSRLYTSSNTRLTVPCSFPSYISWHQIKQRGIKEVQWHFRPKSSSGHGPSQELYSLSPEVSMQWEKKQDKGLNPVTGQGLEKGNLSLTRNRGRGEDEGEYRCLMKFKNGAVLNTTVHVEVLQIFSSPGTELISGQQVSLSCTTGNPLLSDAQLIWFPPEKLSPPIPDLHRANFTIEEVGTGHSGKWKCELRQNNTTLTSAVITLKIEPKLSVWMLVIICSAAVIILLLIVLAVILCRRRQRKKRRPRFCQCKNPKGFYKT